MRPEDRNFMQSLSPTEAAGLTAYLEARNQPILGVACVVFTIRNRAQNGAKGKTWQEVCFWPKQFSCWNGGDPNYTRGVQLAKDMLKGRNSGDIELSTCVAVADFIWRAEKIGKPYEDPVHGAMHYFADSIPKPSWAQGEGVKLVRTIGNHSFYLGVAL